MKEKIQIRVYLPAGACSCSQSGFLERINKAIQFFRNDVECSFHSAADASAKEYGVGYRGVVIGNRCIGVNPTTDQIESAIRLELERNSK